MHADDTVIVGTTGAAVANSSSATEQLTSKMAATNFYKLSNT